MIDPRSSETTGYHLFLQPKGEIALELSRIITDLSTEYGGPVFPPHLTLLSHIQDDAESVLIEKTASLARALAPCTDTLGTLCSEDMYFRALYSRINQQEILTSYHAAAAQAFSVDPHTDYLPHVSLLYGNYDAEPMALSRAQVTLPAQLSFQANSLSLYETHGTVDKWKKVQEFLLGE